VSSDDEDENQVVTVSATLLDGDFLEFTNGRPLPLTDRAKAVFHMSVLNVSAHLSLETLLHLADG
jgi:1-phosphatidylinositol-3-phosphate 5-kinase